jgi:hypothetical protein
MRRVIIESPFAGDTVRNIAYARACVRDSLLRNESPLASHLLYTQSGILEDLVPEERALGIRAGLEWSFHADAIIFCLDHGWSTGMHEALRYHRGFHKTIEYRYLYATSQESAPHDPLRPIERQTDDSRGLRVLPGSSDQDNPL